MTDITENLDNVDLETGEILKDTPATEATKSEPVDYFARVQKGRQDSSQGRQWYAIHTYSGYEDAVKKSILTRMETFHMQDKIFDVAVPKESEVHMRQGKPVSRKKCIFPGYVLLDMIVTDDSWYLVRNTPNVTGFVGAGNTPVTVTPEEFGIIKTRMGEEKPIFKEAFTQGDLVTVNTGPFASFEGKVSEVDIEKGRLTVIVSVFDRDTPIELSFGEVTQS
ncbi:TPA: transcription termination/antitermination factor NusG [Candidatus Gracilibacteria bacterium]|nr:transcription termination/antitermination factor NusG [Candidatus Gracilibacteria bacterium]